MRAISSIIKDSHRTGQELGYILLENLKNRIKGKELIVTDEYFSLMVNELLPNEQNSYSLYATIHDTLISLYNLMQQTSYKFYAGYNVLSALIDKLMILETTEQEHNVPDKLKNIIYKKTASIDRLYDSNQNQNSKFIRTKDSYKIMIDTISFIEAANFFLKIIFSSLKMKDFDCFLYDTTEYYSLIETLNTETSTLFEIVPAAKLAKYQNTFTIQEISKNNFIPKEKDVIYVKQALTTDPFRALKDYTTHIINLQKKEL